MGRGGRRVGQRSWGMFLFPVNTLCLLYHYSGDANLKQPKATMSGESVKRSNPAWPRAGPAVLLHATCYK